MASEWDEVAAEWDDSPSVRAYANAAFGSLRELTEQTGFSLGSAVACDFGCGTGQLTEHLLDVAERVDAVEPSPAMRERLRRRVVRARSPGARVLARLPDDGTLYDLIVCSSVLSFVDDHSSMVTRLAERLRPGGLFVQWDWESDPEEPERGGLSADAIERAMAAAGLAIGGVEPDFVIETDGQRLRPLRGWARREAAGQPATA